MTGLPGVLLQWGAGGSLRGLRPGAGLEVQSQVPGEKQAQGQGRPDGLDASVGPMTVTLGQAALQARRWSVSTQRGGRAARVWRGRVTLGRNFGDSGDEAWGWGWGSCEGDGESPSLRSGPL